MKVNRHLTGKAQFELVYRKGRSGTSRVVSVRTMPNGLALTRYGLTVSKRVGKAVVRNLVKRRLREIIRQTDIAAGWDVVIIARPPAAAAEFSTLNDNVRSLLKQAGVIAGAT